jgi:hypothetical protein
MLRKYEQIIYTSVFIIHKNVKPGNQCLCLLLSIDFNMFVDWSIVGCHHTILWVIL